MVAALTIAAAAIGPLYAAAAAPLLAGLDVDTQAAAGCVHEAFRALLNVAFKGVWEE